jgi:chromosome segregation ATPase
MTWRGYVVLVVLAILLGAGGTYVVLDRRGQRLAAEALARSAADSVQIADLRAQRQALEASAQADSARADQALARADRWRRAATDLGSTAHELRAALDTATTAADSLPRLVEVVIAQDHQIASLQEETVSLREAFAAQQQAAATLTASLRLADSALTVAGRQVRALEDAVRAASRTATRGAGLHLGVGAGLCATGRPCVGLMVVRPLFRIPLT